MAGAQRTFHCTEFLLEQRRQIAATVSHTLKSDDVAIDPKQRDIPAKDGETSVFTNVLP